MLCQDSYMALVIQLYGTKRPSTARVEGRFYTNILHIDYFDDKAAHRTITNMLAVF